jgi:hypothetical protein
VPVTPPPVAVIVSVYVFAAAPDPTAISNAEVPEPGAGMVLGVKVAVMFLPRPDMDNVTAESNPPETMVVTLAVLELPIRIPIVGGKIPTLMAGISAITVKVNVVVCTMLPDVPVIVIGYVPGVVVTPTASVIKTAPSPPVIVAGLQGYGHTCRLAARRQDNGPGKVARWRGYNFRGHSSTLLRGL